MKKLDIIIIVFCYISSVAAIAYSFYDIYALIWVFVSTTLGSVILIDYLKNKRK